MERHAMPDVTIYTTQFCPYCSAAKSLLSRKGAVYREVDVSYDPAERTRMIERAAGRRTVPQIFIGATHVGGSDDLHALDRAGKLDALLAAS
jgi:glutaredoxin 3